jgi:hypothetical protein
MSDAFVPLERVQAARAEAVRVAKRVVAGSKDLFIGLREVVALWPELDVDDEDEGIACLLDVAAEIDDLPIGVERTVWPRKLLAEAEREITNAKRLYRDDLVAAFRRLIQSLAAG